MRYVTDHCTDAGVQKRLRAAGWDCTQWKFIGDPEAEDREIAAIADAMGLVVISINWDFLELRQEAKPRWGYHVHVVGVQPHFPELVERRMHDIDARLSALPKPNILIVNHDLPVKLAPKERYTRDHARAERDARGKRAKGSNAKP
jgi:hypothetical protein